MLKGLNLGYVLELSPKPEELRLRSRLEVGGTIAYMLGSARPQD